MTFTSNPPTLRGALGRKVDPLVLGLEPVLDLVSLRDLRFGLAEMPDITWADGFDSPITSRRQRASSASDCSISTASPGYPQPLTVELDEVLASVPSLRSQWVEIVVDLWGWDGTGRKTPELVAWRHHVTLERIRQVSRNVEGRLTRLGRPVYLPTTRAIADLMTELGESATRFHVARLAMARELITQPADVDALEALESVGLVPAGTWRWGVSTTQDTGTGTGTGATRRGRRPRRRPPYVAAQLAEFRQLVSSLESRNDVYLVSLDADEKPETIRRLLLQAASEAGVEIVVRKHAEGWVVGLMTPDRRRGTRHSAQG